jgi:hypothetical protein
LLADNPNEKRKKGNFHFELSKTIKEKKKTSRPIRKKKMGVENRYNSSYISSL